MLSGSIHERDASPRVHVGIQAPALGGRPYSSQPSQVRYPRKPVGFESPLKCFLIPDIGIYDHRMSGKRGDIGPLHGGIVVIIEVVNDDHFVILPQQSGRELTANEPCSAGD